VALGAKMRAHLRVSCAIATLITLSGVQYADATPLKAAVTLLSPNPLHISQWIADRPHQSTLAIYTLRGLVGDVVAQRMEGRRRLDLRRTATYITWCDLVGEFYTRPWVSILCPRWFPTLVDGTICWQNVLCALALDNFVLAPCIYYPAFYLFKSAAAGCFSVCIPLQQYRKEFLPQMKALWALWIPAGLVNLAMIPPPSRAAFNGVVGLLWVVILSLVTNSLSITEVDMDSGCDVSTPRPDVTSCRDTCVGVSRDVHDRP